ncbi:MAG TPA: hypothetical protein VF142_10135, partial [Longimicrobium sp.]
PTALSLAVVAGVLITSVVASLMFPKEVEEHDPVSHDPLNPADDPPGPILPPHNVERHRESA